MEARRLDGSLASEINELTGLLGVRQLIKSVLLDHGSQASHPSHTATVIPHECVVVHLAAANTARVNAAGPAHPARRVLIRGGYDLRRGTT